MRARGLLLLAALLAGACTERVDGGSCGEDGECRAGETCLFDLDRATTYCTASCADDGDCPRHQTCRTGVIDGTSGSPETRLCVDAVRACSDREPCNGLDDDCDGVVDEEGCEILTRCLDDAPCGAFVCQAPEGQPETLCAPPNAGATVPARGACTSGDQCENGLCESGFCVPMCRPIPDPCAATGEVCAQASLPGGRPKHNLCHAPCGTTTDCPSSTECAWRPVYQAEPSHARVCAELDPDRLPLGSACPNNQPDGGDAMCRHGLCFENTCTRVCGGFGASCADVGPGFACEQRRLLYGNALIGETREFSEFVCVRP